MLWTPLSSVTYSLTLIVLSSATVRYTSLFVVSPGSRLDLARFNFHVPVNGLSAPSAGTARSRRRDKIRRRSILTLLSVKDGSPHLSRLNSVHSCHSPQCTMESRGG